MKHFPLTKLLKLTVCLAKYFSPGMTHHDILKAMEALSSGRIAGRFFEFYPQVYAALKMIKQLYSQNKSNI